MESNQKKAEFENQKDTYTRTLKGYEVHRKKAEAMSVYDESSRKSFELEQQRIENEISKIEKKLDGLSNEKYDNELKISEIGSNLEDCRKQFNTFERWFEKYADLLSRLEDEKVKQAERSRFYQEYENAKHELNECKNRVQTIQDNINEAEAAIREKEVFFGKIEAAKTELGDVPGGTVIEGEWERLLEEYRELKKSQNEAIAVLVEREKGYLDRISEKRARLNEYNLPEEDYSTLSYDENVFAGSKQVQKELGEKEKSLQEKWGVAKQINGECISVYNSAVSNLSEYGGFPLELEHIQGNYMVRKKEKKKALNELNSRKEAETKKANELVRFMDRAQDILERHKIITPTVDLALELNIEKQYNSFSENLKKASNVYANEKKVLVTVLNNEVLKENAYQFNEIQALKSFVKIVENDDFKGDKYFTLSEQVDGVTKATMLRFSQIETDLEEFNKSKSDLLRQCVFQGRRVYDGLRSMAKSSAVSIVEGKPKKQMIKIDIPDEIDTNVAEATINVELDTGIQELVLLVNNNSSDTDIMKTANRVIGSQTLLRKYVGKDNIQVDVYKIDLNPENARYRTWRETLFKSQYYRILYSLRKLIKKLRMKI